MALLGSGTSGLLFSSPSTPTKGRARRAIVHSPSSLGNRCFDFAPQTKGSFLSCGSLSMSASLSDLRARSCAERRSLGSSSGVGPAQCVAALCVFLIERFGDLQHAFQHMDFHRDGRVSCLEFQEVLCGQEKYFDFREAREVFQYLARGTDGSLTWSDFVRHLCKHEPQSPNTRVCFEWDGSASLKSFTSSEYSGAARSGVGGHAWRSAFLGSHQLDAQDDVATNASTRTARSTRSGPAIHLGDRRVNNPKGVAALQTELADFLPTSCGVAVSSTHAAYGSPSGGGSPISSCRANSTGLGKAIGTRADVQGENYVDRSHAPVVSFGALRQDRCNHPVQADAPAVPPGSRICSALQPFQRRSGSQAWFPDSESMHCVTSDSRRSDAVQFLDERLISFRAELAALREMQNGKWKGSSCSSPLFSGPGGNRGCLGSCTTDLLGGRYRVDVSLHESNSNPRVALCTGDRAVGSSATPKLAWLGGQFGCQRQALQGDYASWEFVGMPWLQCLDPMIQTRLASCKSPLDALCVLDVSVPADEDGQSSHNHSAQQLVSSDFGEYSSGRSGRWRSRSRGAVVQTSLASSTCAVVKAAAKLLETQVAQVQSLRSELEQREAQHDMKVLELKEQYSRDVRRSLRRLASQLAPPGSLSWQGQNASAHTSRCTSELAATPSGSARQHSLSHLRDSLRIGPLSQSDRLSGSFVFQAPELKAKAVEELSSEATLEAGSFSGSR